MTVTEIVSDSMLNETYVTVEHVDGITTTYQYIVPSAELSVGDKVRQGDIIGVIAPAGGLEMNDGAHLHFEFAVNGKTIDPTKYFNADDLVYAENSDNN